MRAYVLIETSVSMAGKVANSIRSLQSPSAHLLAVDTVTGPHDIIAIIEAADTDRIGQVVSEDIHQIEGVEKTMSCFVLGEAGHLPGASRGYGQDRAR